MSIYEEFIKIATSTETGTISRDTRMARLNFCKRQTVKMANDDDLKELVNAIINDLSSQYPDEISNLCQCLSYIYTNAENGKGYEQKIPDVTSIYVTIPKFIWVKYNCWAQFDYIKDREDRETKQNITTALFNILFAIASGKDTQLERITLTGTWFAGLKNTGIREVTNTPDIPYSKDTSHPIQKWIDQLNGKKNGGKINYSLCAYLRNSARNDTRTVMGNAIQPNNLIPRDEEDDDGSNPIENIPGKDVIKELLIDIENLENYKKNITSQQHYCESFRETLTAMKTFSGKGMFDLSEETVDGLGFRNELIKSWFPGFSTFFYGNMLKDLSELIPHFCEQYDKYVKIWDTNFLDFIIGNQVSWDDSSKANELLDRIIAYFKGHDMSKNTKLIDYREKCLVDDSLRKGKSIPKRDTIASTVTQNLNKYRLVAYHTRCSVYEDEKQRTQGYALYHTIVANSQEEIVIWDTTPNVDKYALYSVVIHDNDPNAEHYVFKPLSKCEYQVYKKILSGKLVAVDTVEYNAVHSDGFEIRIDNPNSEGDEGLIMWQAQTDAEQYYIYQFQTCKNRKKKIIKIVEKGLENVAKNIDGHWEEELSAETIRLADVDYRNCKICWKPLPGQQVKMYIIERENKKNWEYVYAKTPEVKRRSPTRQNRYSFAYYSGTNHGKHRVRAKLMNGEEIILCDDMVSYQYYY